jgi:2-octaprenyl-6-methoxyphenol hydroxylase
MSNFNSLETDAVTVGAGPAGLAAAIGLATAGACTTLVGPLAPTTPAGETRTAALFPSSLAELRRWQVLDAVRDVSAPLAGIRLIDCEGRLLRAPEVLFAAADVGLAELGWNVPNGALVAALEARVSALAIRRISDTTVTAVEADEHGAHVRLADGRVLGTALVVAADGRRSIAREAAGLRVETWHYPQAAIATSLAHTRDHRGISTELHSAAGPCTTVPLPGRRSSLVWLERPAEVQRLMGLDDAGFRAALEARLQGLLGAVGDIGPRLTYPMGGLYAPRLAARRTVLVGETAHAFPPIGAQGLNLTLRDVAAIASLVGEALAGGEDPGGEKLLDRYHRARIGDVSARVRGVDALNRSLLADMMPVAALRGLGLHALAAVPALKRWIMQQGFGGAGAAGSDRPATALRGAPAALIRGR